MPAINLPLLAGAPLMANTRLQTAATRGLASAAQAVVALAMRETSRKGAVNLGTLKSSWVARQVDAESWQVRNSQIYAAVVEYGRRPGARMPPQGPIKLWVIRKLGVPEAEADDIAFRVARKIAKRGIKGKFILGEVRDNGTIQQIVNREVRREVLSEVATILAEGGTP